MTGVMSDVSESVDVVPGTGLTRREQRAARRKAEIYRVAMELFVAKGFDAVTIDEIAEAALVAKGTFFNYFESKESLLLEYRRSIFDTAHAYGHSLQGDSARELFKKYFRKLSRLVRSEGMQYEMLFAKVVAQPHLLALDAERQVAAQRYFVRYLETGVQSGEVPTSHDLELLAEMLRDLWTGASTAWMVQGREGSLEGSMLRKVDLFFDVLAGAAARGR